MHRLTLTAIGLVVLFTVVNAQRSLSIYKVPDTRASDFEAHVLGDSVLIKYTADYGQAKYDRYYWMFPDGKGRQVPSTKSIFAVNQYGDDIYYYYAEESKEKIWLKAFVDNADGTRTDLADSILLRGRVIGKFIEGNLFILAYDESTRQVMEVEINKVGIIAKRDFTIPEAPLMGTKRFDHAFAGNQATFIDEKSIFNSFLAWKGWKIYRSKGEYYLTDQMFERRSGVRRTLFTPLSNASFQAFDVVEKVGVNSFYSDGRIFRVKGKKRLWALEVIDPSADQVVQSMEISKRNLPSGYYRGQRSISEVRRLKLKKMMGIMSIAVYDENGKDIIFLGSHIFEQPPVVFPYGLGAFASLATLAVTGAIAASGPYESDYYFYGAFDRNTNTLTHVHPKDVTIARNRIDLWEIENFARYGLPDARFYAESNGRAVGLYYWAHEHLVRSVAFDR